MGDLILTSTTFIAIDQQSGGLSGIGDPVPDPGVEPLTSPMTADTGVTWDDLPEPYRSMQGIRILATHQVLQGGETSIEVDANVNVYYAHDDTNGEKPAWLTGAEGWTDTTDTFTPSDGVLREIWQRTFAAGIQYDFTWAHSDYTKRGSYLIGGFMVPDTASVTVRPALYEVINLKSYVAPSNDAIYWDDVPTITGETSYASITLLNAAIVTASPGDVLTLEVGTHSGNIVISGKTGITVAGDVFGSVLLNGTLDAINSNNIIITGFTVPTTNVSSNKWTIDENCTWIRATNNFFNACNDATPSTEETWIRIEGKYCRTDHNTFFGKTGEGSEIKVSSSTAATPFACRVDHNSSDDHQVSAGFGAAEVFKMGNNPDAEELQIHLCDHNFISDWNTAHESSETELVGNKTDGVIFWSNEFFRCYGSVSLRIATGTFAIANKFDGVTETLTGGFVIKGSDNGGDHVLAINEFIDLNPGSSNARACFKFSQTNGTSFKSPVNTLICSNIVSGGNFALGMTGSDIEPTQDIHFCGEAYDAGTQINDSAGDIGNQTFEGCVMNTTLGVSPTPSGITVADPVITTVGGILVASNGSIDPGVNTQWPVIVEDTFSTGKTW